MIKTKEIESFCCELTNNSNIKDFPGASNGIQIANNGEVSKIGAAVDAGLVSFQRAISKKIDFLITHHGLFWSPPIPITCNNYDKIKLCLDNNLAIFSSHLPLDCHPEIGNNALLAKKLGLIPMRGFVPYEGSHIGLITKNKYSNKELKKRLSTLFPKGIIAIEFGSEKPSLIGILTGSGQSAVNLMIDSGIDTLITGELKQQHYNFAQENKLNLYVCGHYATETFGVDTLGKKVAEEFNLPYSFIDSDCPF